MPSAKPSHNHPSGSAPNPYPNANASGQNPTLLSSSSIPLEPEPESQPNIGLAVSLAIIQTLTHQGVPFGEKHSFESFYQMCKKSTLLPVWCWRCSWGQG